MSKQGSTLIAVPFLFFLTLCALGAVSQHLDVLDLASRTAVYVETDHSANPDRPNCDWYASADDYLATEFSGRFIPDCVISIRLRGAINMDGAFLFADVVDRAEASHHAVSSLVIDSHGGDADAAISIGKLISRSEIFEKIPVVGRIGDDFESVCFSACVVLLAATHRKDLEFNINNNPALPSRIGIHGPGQYDRKSRRYDTTSTNREIMRINQRLKDYFVSVGVAEQLVDDMFGIPFNEIRLLTREELIAYGILQN